jgi:hypothetical protein
MAASSSIMKMGLLFSLGAWRDRNSCTGPHTCVLQLPVDKTKRQWPKKNSKLGDKRYSEELAITDFRLPWWLISWVFTVWMWAMLPVFRKYILPPSPGLKCEVGVYIYMFQKHGARKGEVRNWCHLGEQGQWTRKAPCLLVHFTALTRAGCTTFPVHCPSCPEYGAPFPTFAPHLRRSL